MTTKAEVKIEREPGVERQWGRKFFYFRDGLKHTLRKKELSWAGGLTFLVILVISGLQGVNDQPPIGKPSPISLPENASSEKPVNFGDGKESYRTSGARKNAGQRRRVALMGPELIVRKSGLSVPPGSSLKARLVGAGTDGLIRARSEEEFYFNSEALIEEGVMFIGQASSGESRLKITFSQIVLRDGTTLSVTAEAFDPKDGLIGLSGSRVGREAGKLGASIGLNFVGGLSEGLQDDDVQGGVAVKKPTMKNALLNGAATAALDQSRDLLSEFKSQHPQIVIPEGREVLIIFEGN